MLEEDTGFYKNKLQGTTTATSSIAGLKGVGTGQMKSVHYRCGQDIQEHVLSFLGISKGNASWCSNRSITAAERSPHPCSHEWRHVVAKLHVNKKNKVVIDTVGSLPEQPASSQQRAVSHHQQQQAYSINQGDAGVYADHGCPTVCCPRV